MSVRFNFANLFRLGVVSATVFGAVLLGSCASSEAQNPPDQRVANLPAATRADNSQAPSKPKRPSPPVARYYEDSPRWVIDTDFHVTKRANGRVPDQNTLAYNQRPCVCEPVFEDLNAARAFKPLPEGETVRSHEDWQDAIMGTQYSLAWDRLSETASYREAVIVDIDNDGDPEEVHRYSDETRYGFLLQTLYAVELNGQPAKLIKESRDAAARNLESLRIRGERQRNKFGRLFGYGANHVKTDQAIINSRTAFVQRQFVSGGAEHGQFEDIVSVDGRNYILSGGSNPYHIPAKFSAIWLLEFQTVADLTVLCKFQPLWQTPIAEDQE